MFIQFMLKTIELIILIMNTSYILGMAWIIFLEAVEDFALDKNPKEFGDFKPETSSYFLSEYGMIDKTPADNIILVMYFSFTSLSTVGFGDYYPHSDYERIVIAFVLLFGVAIFSYIMGIFLNILESWNAFNSDHDEGEQLIKFFGTLKKFNGDENIDTKLKTSIEEYFNFKWANDRNLAFRDSGDIAIFTQLPQEV